MGYPKSFVSQTLPPSAACVLEVTFIMRIPSIRRIPCYYLGVWGNGSCQPPCLIRLLWINHSTQLDTDSAAEVFMRAADNFSTRLSKHLHSRDLQLSRSSSLLSLLPPLMLSLRGRQHVSRTFTPIQPLPPPLQGVSTSPVPTEPLHQASLLRKDFLYCVCPISTSAKFYLTIAV